MQQHYDIIIYGAGHAGSVLAARLGSVSSLRILLVKPSWQQSYKPLGKPSRLFAMGHGSLQILHSSGISIRGQEINRILVYEQDGFSKLEFAPQHIGYHDLGLMVQEEDLHTAAMQSMPHTVEHTEGLLRKITSHDGYALLSLSDGRKYSCSLIVAADGKHSDIRKQLNAKCYLHDYNQFALACEVSHRNHHQGLAIEKFMPSGPFAILPKSGGYASAVVWTLPKQQQPDFVQAEQQRQHQLIAAEFPAEYQDVAITSTIEFFPLTMQIMKTPYQQRIVFLGDAAHSIHPLAGQGFNLALRGIDVLATNILNHHRFGLDVGCPLLLRQYAKERRKDLLAVSLTMHLLNWLFSYRNPLIKWWRNCGLWLFNRLSFLKNFFLRYAIAPHNRSLD